MADDDIEIGEDLQIDVVVDENNVVIGAISDDLVVASGPDGSVVDETIDVLDADGNLLLEDEKISVYDADADLIAQSETVVLPSRSSAHPGATGRRGTAPRAGVGGLDPRACRFTGAGTARAQFTPRQSGTRGRV